MFRFAAPATVVSAPAGGLLFPYIRQEDPSDIFFVCIHFYHRFDFDWSWQRGSNPRPPDYKAGALPSELCQHMRKETAPAVSRFVILCIDISS